MKINHLKTLICISFLLAFMACKNTMDEHVEVINTDNTINLTDKIAQEPNLSKFSSFLKTTGYDALLASSQNYTVWAPTNEALAGLDPAIVNDAAKLKDYVANHIALTTVLAPKNQNDTIRVALINKKYANITQNTFEEATVSTAAKFVKNGAFYMIDKPVPTKLNVWDFMLSSADAPLQTNFISNISVMVIDTANATIIGYDGDGRPIFEPNSPMIARNAYWNNVADLRTESQQYTFIMLQDAAFVNESNKLTPYYTTDDKFNLVADFTFLGCITPNRLPDTLVSIKGVKVPIQKSAIVKTYKASNGIVYVLNNLSIPLKNKIKTFKIEGENPSFFRSNRSGNTFYRLKLDNQGLPYKDIQVYNHGTAEFYINYTRPALPLVKYKVYARAISGAAGDSQVTTYTQRYLFYDPIAVNYTLFATQNVAPLTYNEVYLGEYTPTQYATLNFRLLAANSSSVNVNTLILDYLKFEPVLP